MTLFPLEIAIYSNCHHISRCYPLYRICMYILLPIWLLGYFVWFPVKYNSLDDLLILVWSSAASYYYKLKDEDYCIDFSGCNDTGKLFYYYYYTSQAQLWVDGCNFYHCTRTILTKIFGNSKVLILYSVIRFFDLWIWTTNNWADYLVAKVDSST